MVQVDRWKVGEEAGAAMKTFILYVSGPLGQNPAARTGVASTYGCGRI